MLPQDRDVDDRERQDFWEEIKFLRHLQCSGGHENIVEFIGYVAGEEMMLLLEFAPGGSLLGFLRDRERGDSLPELKAVTFAAEIASGMRYIAAKKMVHRDLAARNVLLSKVGVCKITDFGLARDVYDSATLQYQANVGYKTSNPTAYKWTSLEGLTQSVFTIEGDVWSFAIVLSEISSLGNNPYVQYRRYDCSRQLTVARTQSQPGSLGAAHCVHTFATQCFWRSKLCARVRHVRKRSQYILDTKRHQKKSENKNQNTTLHC